MLEQKVIILSDSQLEPTKEHIGLNFASMKVVSLSKWTQDTNRVHQD